MKCDCCKEMVHRVDDNQLCFGCSIVQEFAAIIAEQTSTSDDDAMDLACELAEHVQSRILELDMEATPEEHATFLQDVAKGMTRVARNH